MGCKVKELRFGLHKCRTPVARRPPAAGTWQARSALTAMSEKFLLQNVKFRTIICVII